MDNKRVFMLITCLALLMVVFSGTVASATNPNQASKVAFKTPEEAITSYLAGVAQGDLRKILEACAIDEMSENFKFDVYIERLRAFVPFQSPAPANDPFYVELNKAQISSQISSQVKLFTFSLLSTENVIGGSTIMMDVERATSFMKAVDPKRLAKLEVKKIALPNKTLMSSTRYLDNAAKIAHVYGADESTERVVLFSFEQNYYFLGFTLLRYGENWKISSQNSALANTSALGAPQKTTVEEFEKMVNGN
jgi:hypothetical protein